MMKRLKMRVLVELMVLSLVVAASAVLYQNTSRRAEQAELPLRTYPDLSSRIYAGRADGTADLDVSAITSVKFTPQGWVYDYQFTTKQGPVQIRVNVQTANCREFVKSFPAPDEKGRGFEVNGCEFVLDVSDGTISFSARSNSAPKESTQTWEVLTLKGREAGAGPLAFYVPSR